MTIKYVARFVTSNFTKIEADVEAALFYAGLTRADWELIQYRNPVDSTVLVIHRGEFAGSWSIVKHNKPLWGGHNGYTFERATATTPVQIVQLWEITPRTADERDMRILAAVETALNACTTPQEITVVEDAFIAQASHWPDDLVAAFDALVVASHNALPTNDPTEVFVSTLETVNACSSETEIYNFTNGIDFTEWSGEMVTALTDAVETKIATFKAPVQQPHKHRETVINRAIRQNHYITDSDVIKSHTLRDVAMDFVQTYKGTNSFIQDLALRLIDGGALSHGQMRGALNVMVREAKIELGKPLLEPGVYGSQSTVDALTKSPFYVDMSDKPQPSIYVEEHNGRIVPNGTYTVPLNDHGEYRVIKLTDCPEHFNKPAGTQIAAYQMGADNETDFVGFAFVNGASKQIWRKYLGNSAICIALNTLLTTGRSGEFGKIWAMASGKCFICGRKLTVPISKQAGIGPICAENGGFDIYALAALNIDPVAKLVATGVPNVYTQMGESLDKLGTSSETARTKAQADIDELFES